MAWVALIVAGLLEVVWAYYMKLCEGFTKFGPSVIVISVMIVSFILLSYAMKHLPLGTTYAVWTGIGALGTFMLGIFLLGEQASAARVASAVLILAGIVGLKISA